jgi:hypothetical protein
MPSAPGLGWRAARGGGEQDRPAGQRPTMLTPIEVALAVQAVEGYEQAVRHRRAHEWWGRRPTWRKEPLASGDPMRVLEALEHLARLTAELPS